MAIEHIEHFEVTTKTTTRHDVLILNVTHYSDLFDALKKAQTIVAQLSTMFNNIGASKTNCSRVAMYVNVSAIRYDDNENYKSTECLMEVEIK